MRHWKTIAIIIVICFVLLGVGGFLKDHGLANPFRNNPQIMNQIQSIPYTGQSSKNQYVNDTIVTSNPVDLRQIARISKFRSCFGHDFSGSDTSGNQETDRSMKHYFQALPTFVSTNKIKIFAPFNGTVVMDDTQLDAPFGHQMMIASKINPNEVVDIFHIIPASGVTLNTQVNSGQLLGVAQPPDGQTFDIAFGWTFDTSIPVPSVLDSIFNHMNPQVLSQYQSFGVTQTEIITSQAIRDAQSCQYPPNHQIGSPLADSPNNWIVLH